MILLMWVLAVVYAVLTSCTRTVQRVVETHDTIYVGHTDVASRDSVASRTDSVRVAKRDSTERIVVHRDSVVVRDSVFVRERGDTLYIYKERWNERLVVRHDTIREVATDTMVVYVDRMVAVRDSAVKADTTYRSATAGKVVVKERRRIWDKVWLVIAGLAGVGMCFFLVRWWRGR